MTLVAAPANALPDAPSAQIAVTEKRLPLAILKDQIPIWTSPVRIRTHDLIWLLPLGAATGLTLTTDTDAMRDISHDRTFNKNSVNASDYLLGCQIAVPVALYSVGLFKGNAHARETGILSGEAVADSAVVEVVTKIIFRRERPLYNNAAGDFFSSNTGSNGSFPSSHSMLAWTLAGVLAGEYPSKWMQAGVYSVASGVRPDARPRARTFPDGCPAGRRRRMVDRALRVREASRVPRTRSAAGEALAGEMSADTGRTADRRVGCSRFADHSSGSAAIEEISRIRPVPAGL